MCYILMDVNDEGVDTPETQIINYLVMKISQ